MGVPMPAMMAAMGGMRMPGGGPPPANPGAPGASNGPPAQARPQKMEIPTGPAVTVFVGNITERAPDAMVRHLLTTCGNVLSWKRVQGATGKLQAFGFCELSNPDAGLRAIRLLNGYAIADKSLVVKVDAKTKKVLDDYLTDRMKKNGDEEKELDGYCDDDMKYDDNLAKERVANILKDHSKEIESFVPSEGTQLPVQREAPPASTLLQRMGNRDEGLDNVEDEKKGIISKEIEKFRETMKIREAEREEKGKEKDKDREREREKDRDRGDRDRKSSPPASRKSRDRSRSREREARSRDARSSTRASRRRSPSPPARISRVSRSRSRSREPRVRATRSEERNKSEKDREMEAEEKERRKAEKKATEKEENYQARLMAWERRESKKAHDYGKDKKKEKQKADDTEKEAKKLKEFLEDYDDEKDDPKYYRGRELARRMSVREREAAKDADDRAREAEEVEELKKQIFSNASVKDPDAEFAKRLRERENQFLPPGAQQKQQQQQQRAASPAPAAQPAVDQSPDNNMPSREPSPMEDSYGGGGYDNGDDDHQDAPPSPEAPEPTINPISLPGTKMETVSKRRKIQVADIFNQDQDDDEDHKPKKKLKPLPLAAVAKKEKQPEKTAADEKKQHIKSLIEKIPTDKTALFEYVVDWDLVDNQLMEKRIRPWVNKKIAEYIGEPEPSLTDFICSKVLAGSMPKAILDDVQMVLDEEAEVFVVKMWRLLIYEIENKKQKSTAPVK